MKTRILATLIAGLVFAGCGDDDDDHDHDTVTIPPSGIKTQFQAYSTGPINGMLCTATCGSETIRADTITDGEGYANIYSETFAQDPSACSMTCTAVPGSINMANSQDLSGVTYEIGVGVMTGDHIAVSPFTTLMAATGATAKEFFGAIGLDLTDAEIAELISNPAAALAAQPTALSALGDLLASMGAAEALTVAIVGTDIELEDVPLQKVGEVVQQAVAKATEAGDLETTQVIEITFTEEDCTGADCFEGATVTVEAGEAAEEESVNTDDWLEGASGTGGASQ